jgi:hypothetical protein
MKILKVLIGCEESQEVMKAFLDLGHEAISCDLKECSGGYPERHFKGDVFEAIKGGKLTMQDGNEIFVDKWDVAIFHPECTYLTVSANKWYKDQPERKSGTLVGEARRQAREKAIQFVLDLYYSNIEYIRIENPIGVLSSRWRKPDNVLQPWMFGHGETKATCLWNKNLPPIIPTNIVEGREQKLHLLPPSKNRAELRSKTYPGIAKAIAEQTVNFLIKKTKWK